MQPAGNVGFLTRLMKVTRGDDVENLGPARLNILLSSLLAEELTLFTRRRGPARVRWGQRDPGQ